MVWPSLRRHVRPYGSDMVGHSSRQGYLRSTDNYIVPGVYKKNVVPLSNTHIRPDPLSGYSPSNRVVLAAQTQRTPPNPPNATPPTQPKPTQPDTPTHPRADRSPSLHPKAVSGCQPILGGPP